MISNVYSSHPLHSTIGLVLARRDNPEFGITPVIEDATASLNRDRIFAVANVVDSALKETPAALASIPLLNQLELYWQAVTGELVAFQNDRDVGHLSTAASYIDSHIQSVLATFLLGSGSSAKRTAMPAIMQQQAKYAQETLNNFAQMRDVSFNQLESLGMTASHIEERLRRADEALLQQKVDSENAVSRLDRVFEEQEAKRNEHNQRVLDAFRADAQARQDESVRLNNAHVEYLQQQEDAAARIVQLLGDKGATGNYQRLAATETKQANVWRRIAVGFFVFGVGLAIATVIKHWGDSDSVNSGMSVLLKLLTAVVITAPAWYAAKESARHRTIADRARQAELELASIGPFIELMPEAKKVEIREHLSKLYFGRSVDTHNVTPSIDIKTLTEAIVEFAKSYKPDKG